MLGIQLVSNGGGVELGRRPALALSNLIVPDGAARDRRIGRLMVHNRPFGVSYTFTVTNDPDNKFTLDGSDLVLSDEVRHGAGGGHDVAITAVPSSAGEATLERRFLVRVAPGAPIDTWTLTTGDALATVLTAPPAPDAPAVQADDRSVVFGTWIINVGIGSAAIVVSPLLPASPTVTAGDASATVF